MERTLNARGPGGRAVGFLEEASMAGAEGRVEGEESRSTGGARPWSLAGSGEDFGSLCDDVGSHGSVFSAHRLHNPVLYFEEVLWWLLENRLDEVKS